MFQFYSTPYVKKSVVVDFKLWTFQKKPSERKYQTVLIPPSWCKNMRPITSTFPSPKLHVRFKGQGKIPLKNTIPKDPWDVMGCQKHLLWGPRGVTFGGSGVSIGGVKILRDEVIPARFRFQKPVKKWSRDTIQNPNLAWFTLMDHHETIGTYMFVGFTSCS